METCCCCPDGCTASSVTSLETNQLSWHLCSAQDGGGTVHRVAVPKLGCSKCRYSKNGCGQCRAAREEALQACTACTQCFITVAFAQTCNEAVRERN